MADCLQELCAFKTSRVFQFVMAFMAMTSAQKGVLWWASKHRHHHKNSDQPADVHSVKQKGLYYSHVGWIFDKNHKAVDLKLIPDFARFPELVWLEKLAYVPTILFAVFCWLIGSWQGLFWGYFVSTTLLSRGMLELPTEMM